MTRYFMPILDADLSSCLMPAIHFDVPFTHSTCRVKHLEMMHQHVSISHFYMGCICIILSGQNQYCMFKVLSLIIRAHSVQNNYMHVWIYKISLRYIVIKGTHHLLLKRTVVTF